MSNIVEFPKQYSSVEEALEAAKGWNFESVFILGHTADGGSAEGGTIITSGGADQKHTAKNLFFIAEICKWTALKLLGYT